MNEVVAVVGLNKGTKYIAAVTSCDRSDADIYAKYYRKIGYSARILTYEELDELQKKQYQERFRRFPV